MGHKLPRRTRERIRAVDVLYEAHVRGWDTPEGIFSLSQLRQDETTAQTPLPAYAVEILEGVAEHLERIDAALATYSKAWPLHRMPEVDLAIMRVAAWEILFNPDVTGPVAITAAMQIAEERSTDESPKFINGLLGAIDDMRDTLSNTETDQTLSGEAIAKLEFSVPQSFDTVAKTAAAGGVLEQIDLDSLE
ncbi:transcription antitermination factor NusB [Mobiluncus curtisii]|uniref:transcription antitermination factor NusB n=1 Tax=Mobiluncus curtisii TaxID=2051 RepID=UPI0001E0AD20|nr:transcription antitermination factor NusB [Mobiluncus curtisii]EFL94496.1 transcription antitermination factor NusB [Mobiluncus curtisii subsp. curtisii ATCC 35241]QQT13282.1 transcription antitermination factor NusB [Mobiluncus curtisii]STY77069.1 N utilization substance protein B homolog [Mobiluncus curtisii subsp. curtisii]